MLVMTLPPYVIVDVAVGTFVMICTVLVAGAAVGFVMIVSVTIVAPGMVV